MTEVVKIANVGDVSPGEAIAVEVGDRMIALFNVDGAYYAIDDTCTHRGGPLSEGVLEEKTVTCPWHGATFDVTTGEVLGPPASIGVNQLSGRGRRRRYQSKSTLGHKWRRRKVIHGRDAQDVEDVWRRGY